MKLQHGNSALEAGTDEAGRGCLCGPVTAAAVILPPDFKNEFLNDSKQLTAKQRYALRPIIEKEAIAWAYAHVSPQEIDEINILNASILAMHKSISALKVQPDFIAVDGNRFKPYNDVAFHCQVKGDATYMNIAAASILAKTYRDDKMRELAIAYPQYGWERNAGYPTKGHRAAIRSHGPTPHHRMTFRLLPSQLDLFDL
ncbi:MAG: ribonuclease HII [Flavobacteriales bacterium]|jgi:ribonuclease HII|tara:strand:- start:3140 stop:3739 length:600 start_codon:yes stop_codon:yes gene_type:complete